MQCPNWSLHYLIFQEGIPLHVEHGNIFRRKDTTRVLNEEDQALLDSLEYKEITKIDKDGNVVTVKVY